MNHAIISLKWGDFIQTKQGYFLNEAEIGNGDFGVYSIKKPTDPPESRFFLFRLTITRGKPIGNYGTLEEAGLAGGQDLFDVLKDKFSD